MKSKWHAELQMHLWVWGDYVADSVVDPHHFNADPDPDPACHFDADPDITFPFDADADSDPTFHSYADPDPEPSFQIKVQTPENVLKKDHILYILACHLQIDEDQDPAYHFDGDPDPDPDPSFQFYADPCWSGSESESTAMVADTSVWGNYATSLELQKNSFIIGTYCKVLYANICPHA